MPLAAVARFGTSNSEEIRRRALARLYQRKAVVDDLIRSLENYDRTRRKPQSIPFNVERKCS